MPVWPLGEQPELSARVWSPGHGVQFEAVGCSLRGVGGQRAESYLGSLVSMWSLGKFQRPEPKYGCALRRVGGQMTVSYLGFLVPVWPRGTAARVEY